MYRTIDSRFWSDVKVRQLAPDAKLLFLYLITNSHSHVAGIYYLPPSLVAHETGIKETRIDTLYDALSRAGLTRIDKERDVVWVINMLAYQGRGDKNHRAAAAQLNNLHNSPLIVDFLKTYEFVRPFFRDRVSKGNPGQVQSGTPEQEQEQEKNSICIAPEIFPSGGEERLNGEGERAHTRSIATTDDFERFWQVFPKGRKHGKGDARKAWIAATQKASAEAIIKAAAEYAESPVGRGQYVKGPAPWLNQECWDDDRAAWYRGVNDAAADLLSGIGNWMERNTDEQT